VLNDQPVVQRGKVHGPITLLAAPVFDRLVHNRSPWLLPTAAIDRIGLHPLDLVAHRALGHP
jgi:hypothetical protein